ncbi:MAG: hypothetical protein EXR91_09675 [Gemmatimonadetes bacterium]|nr:hypothetical protein [Gemmatimonadota bacterium]
MGGLSAQSASAQATMFLSAGAGIPVSDYADYASVGWMAQGGVAFPVGSPGLAVGVGGLYGSNGHDIDGDRTDLLGAAAFVQYTIGDPASTSGYVFGGPGYVKHSFMSDTFPDASASGLAASGGAGVNIPMGGLTGYVEGMYLTGFGDIDGTDIVVASVGISFVLNP